MRLQYRSIKGSQYFDDDDDDFREWKLNGA